MSALERAHLIFDGPVPGHLREAALDADMREWRRARPVEEKIASLIEVFEARSVIAAEEAASEWRRCKCEIRKSRRCAWPARQDYVADAIACLARREKWRRIAAQWRDAAELAKEELA